MLTPENEQRLQNLFNRLNDDELEAVYAFATHLDEETTLRAVRRQADGDLEITKEDRQVSELEAGFRYGESAGIAITRDTVVGEIGRLMTSPLNQR